jgi:hypothetical protein
VDARPSDQDLTGAIWAAIIELVADTVTGRKTNKTQR